MTYTEEPWNPVWHYKLNWSGEYSEIYEIKETNMTKQEQDEKEFEEEFKKAGGKNLNEPIDVTTSIYLWAKWAWLASRRLFRESLLTNLKDISSKDMPPEFIEFVNKHFWELV